MPCTLPATVPSLHRARVVADDWRVDTTAHCADEVTSAQQPPRSRSSTSHLCYDFDPAPGLVHVRQEPLASVAGAPYDVVVDLVGAEPHSWGVLKRSGRMAVVSFDNLING